MTLLHHSKYLNMCRIPNRLLKTVSLACDQGAGYLGVPDNDGFAGSAVNDILNMPPHHLTHWRKETLSALARLFGLEVVTINTEPVASYHESWAGSSVWQKRIRDFLGRQHRLVDVSFGGRVIARLAAAAAHAWPIRGTETNGHTMVAIYGKPCLFR